MEFMHYRRDQSFQRNPTTTNTRGVVTMEEGNGEMTVEDLVLSMRQDFFVDSESDSTSPSNITIHRQPGAVSVRINGMGQQQEVENKLEVEGLEDGKIEQIIMNGNGVRCTDDHIPQAQLHHFACMHHAPASASSNMAQPHRSMVDIPVPYSGSQYQEMHPLRSSKEKTELAAQQHFLSNGFAKQSHSQPQLASQFYQQLQMNLGSASKNPNSHHQASTTIEQSQYPLESPVYSPLSVNNGPLHAEPEISPRMLPKPPQEPRRGSRTRSSLRRAANLLLNRSRQSLSDGETTRKPTPPSNPRDEINVQCKKESKSQTIRERLQKNKSRMGDLLRSPSISHMRRSSQDNFSTDSSLSSDVHHVETGYRKYASAENLSMNQTSQHTTPNSDSQPHEIIANTNTCRSDDTDEHNLRSQPPGYKLRRHASGPVYQASDAREKWNLDRGYHTADSDTDSGIGRIHLYGYPTHHRNETYKAMPSARDTLHMLSKNREVSNASNRQVNKTVSGPVRADHNIQPVGRSGVIKAHRNVQPGKIPNEWSPTDKPDHWTEQGARPKRSSSIESLETEDVKHEIFPDTPIRSGYELANNSIDQGAKYEQCSSSMKADKCIDDGKSRHAKRPQSASRSRPASPSTLKQASSRSRPPSPSRSVHFEDSHLPQDETIGPKPHSQSKSRKQRSSTENSKYQMTNATSAKNKSNSVSGEEFVNLNQKNLKISQGNRSSGYSSTEDSYSSVTDPYVIHDDNPYEEIQISQHIQNRKSSRTPLNNNDYEVDSIDGLYAKVEKKRHRRKKDCHDEKDRELSDGKRQRSAVNPEAYGEPIYATIDKSKKKPPSALKHDSRPRSQSDVSRASNSNPCVTSDFDDRISHGDNHSSDDSPFKRNMEHYSDLSGSRLSITSRSSISDRMQSIGKATKKKLTSMRRALSLDRIDTVGKENDSQPKLKRSPSLQYLTGIFNKKEKKQSESESPGKLNKRRSASLSGLYVRPQRTSEETDVTSPSHMRKVGKLLSINSDGSQIVELVKPPSGPFGFYIARGTSTYGSGIFVTRLGDGHPAKILAGLLSVGDEILDINGVDVRTRSIDDVYDMMMDNNKLILRLVPIATRNTYTE